MLGVREIAANTIDEARAESLLVRAEALLAARKIESCLQAIDLAEAAGADADRCAGNRWLCWMLLGHMERAWQESDAIRSRGAPDGHRVWDGSSLVGKRVLVRSLHGFGDAIQCIRYAPVIRQCAASVVVQVAPRLVELLRRAAAMHDCGIEVLPWGQARAPWDIEVEITELPYIFRTDVETIPNVSPYLSVPSEFAATVGSAMQRTRAPHGIGLRIGLVWGCGEWNRSRMIPLAMLEPLLARGDGRFYSLQGGEDNAAWTQMRARYDLEDASDYGDGLLTLAAVMEHLDLVITIDTMAAHLAGAMGKPVWLLLQYAADWRWMIDRADSPWYPSMRIFRQQTPRIWADVIDAVGRELDILTPAACG